MRLRVCVCSAAIVRDIRYTYPGTDGGVCQESHKKGSRMGPAAAWHSFDNILLASDDGGYLMAALHISAGRQMATTMIVSQNKDKQWPCPWVCGCEGFEGWEGYGRRMYIGYIGPIQSGAKPSTWLRLVTSATCAYEWHYTLWHGAVRGFSRFKSCELRIMHCNGSHSDYSTLTRWYGNRLRFELHSCDAGK